MMAQCHHYQCFKCHILATSVANIILSYCLCCVSDDIIKNAHKTPQKIGFEEEKSFDKEYKSFATEKPTQISFLEGSAPLYIVRERLRSVTSFGGVLALCALFWGRFAMLCASFRGSDALFERILNC
jgi:hypothetical protein